MEVACRLFIEKLDAICTKGGFGGHYDMSPGSPFSAGLWPQLLEVLLADRLQLSALSGLTSAAGSDLAQGLGITSSE